MAWNIFSVCLSRSIESATENVFHMLLRNVYECERDRTNFAILNFYATIDLLKKRRKRSSAEFLEEELRSWLLSETFNVTEKFRLQVLLLTVLFHMLPFAPQAVISVPPVFYLFFYVLWAVKVVQPWHQAQKCD